MGAPKGNQYAKGNKTSGRPLIYDDDYIENEASELLAWIANDAEDKYYIGCFAKDKPYTSKKLVEFAHKNKVFQDAWDKAKEWQLRKFVINGLTKKWDSNFCQYLMARICDPIFKKSWDREEDKAEQNITVNINKVVKEK